MYFITKIQSDTRDLYCILEIHVVWKVCLVLCSGYSSGEAGIVYFDVNWAMWTVSATKAGMNI